jgi:hypothetical protein
MLLQGMCYWMKIGWQRLLILEWREIFMSNKFIARTQRYTSIKIEDCTETMISAWIHLLEIFRIAKPQYGSTWNSAWFIDIYERRLDRGKYSCLIIISFQFNSTKRGLSPSTSVFSCAELIGDHALSSKITYFTYRTRVIRIVCNLVTDFFHIGISTSTLDGHWIIGVVYL